MPWPASSTSSCARISKASNSMPSTASTNADNEQRELHLGAESAGYRHGARSASSTPQNTSGTLIVGTNTANSKGNITAYVGYQEQKPVYWAARDYSACTLSSDRPHRQRHMPAAVRRTTTVSSRSIMPACPSAPRILRNGHRQGGSGKFAPYAGPGIQLRRRELSASAPTRATPAASSPITKSTPPGG